MPRGRFGNGAGHGGPAKGPGQGPGWGGPAKGTGSDAPKHEPFNGDFGQNVPGRWAANIASSQELQEFYTAMLRDEEQHGMTRIAAADRLYDRIEGKAVQRSVNVNINDPSSLSDAELDLEIERRAGSLAPALAGEAPQGLPN